MGFHRAGACGVEGRSTAGTMGMVTLPFCVLTKSRPPAKPVICRESPSSTTRSILSEVKANSMLSFSMVSGGGISLSMRNKPSACNLVAA